jgi:hypothetical protein
MFTNEPEHTVALSLFATTAHTVRLTVPALETQGGDWLFATVYVSESGPVYPAFGVYWMPQPVQLPEQFTTDAVPCCGAVTIVSVVQLIVPQPATSFASTGTVTDPPAQTLAESLLAVTPQTVMLTVAELDAQGGVRLFATR